MSLQDDLNRIADLQGKSIPPGNRIEGFGPNDPPAPDSIQPAAVRYGPPLETDEPEGYDDPQEPPVSPLIPRVAPESAPLVIGPTAPRLAAVAPFVRGAVTVVDAVASVEGRSVELEAKDVEAIRQIVLRADLRKLKSLLPRRKRASRSAGAAPAPARRGRPKKAQS